MGHSRSKRLAGAIATSAALLAATCGVSPAGAENPRLIDPPPHETPIRLVPQALNSNFLGSAPAPMSFSPTRYYVDAPIEWASERNHYSDYVIGAVHEGDVFDASEAFLSTWRGGHSYRVHCGSVLSSSLTNSNSPAAAQCSTSEVNIPPQQFIGTANCQSCGTYTTAGWASALPATFSACRNLIPPVTEVTASTHATCRDPVTINKTDVMGWRYTSKDYQWVEIKDTHLSDGDMPWMFVPLSYTALVCHVSGCWTP